VSLSFKILLKRLSYILFELPPGKSVRPHSPTNNVSPVKSFVPSTNKHMLSTECPGVSGRSGFHIHVLDFNYRDWAAYRENDPLWCHSASRYKLTKLLQTETHVFNRAHFTTSVDPMRLITVPNSARAHLPKLT